MSVTEPLFQTARGKLAFMQDCDNSDCLASQCIKDGVVLDAETSKTRLQMINRKSDVRMPSQGFEALFESAHVERGLARSKLTACIGSDV